MNPSIPKLYVPIGIPSCGKSTYYVDHYATNGVVHVSPDQYLYSGGVYRTNTDLRRQAWKQALERAKSQLMDGVSLYYDATNLNKRSRQLLLHYARHTQHPYWCVALWFTTTLDACVERNKVREPDRRVAVEDLKDMWANLGRPVLGEGFQEMRDA